jgi:hypothetical protein
MANPSYGRAFVPRPRQPGSMSPPDSSGAPAAPANGHRVTGPSGRSTSRPGETPTVEAPAFPRTGVRTTRYAAGEPRHSVDDPEAPGRSVSRRGWNWLLLIPLIAPLLTPLYNRISPELFGIPFFYWYQLGCALLAIVVIAVVYQLTKDRD